MNLEEQVLDIIRGQVSGGSAVTLASDLRKELHLDSFGTLMIINAIEDTLDRPLDESDFARVNTPAEIVSLLRSKYRCQPAEV